MLVLPFFDVVYAYDCDVAMKIFRNMAFLRLIS